jgi:hypothetical protein
MSAVRNRRDWALDLARTGARRLSAPRPAIGYIGWTFADNLGDDAMFEAVQELLPQRLVETFIGARREAMLARVGLSGTRTFSRIFLGGGTLINHGYLGVVRRALDFGVPVRTLGTGVGSSGFSATSETPPEDWRDLLARFECIGVRGPHSLQKLQKMGVEAAEIVGDLALALTPDAPLAGAENSRFLLNAAAPSAPDGAFPTDRVITELADAAKQLVARGLEPIPVAFCAEDCAPLRAVLDRAGISARIERPRTADDFFRHARLARLSVGVRLHCAVLSVCAGLAPLAVAYRGKGKDFAASVGLEEWMAAPEASGLAERAIALADLAPAIGAQAHSAALGWRETLRRYVADV